MSEIPDSVWDAAEEAEEELHKRTLDALKDAMWGRNWSQDQLSLICWQLGIKPEEV